jgi:IS5 family transposase
MSAPRGRRRSPARKVLGRHEEGAEGRRADPIDEDINRLIAKVRARVEHPFRVIKRQFGYLKTRYRGLAKNRAQLFTLFALGNLFLVRRRLLA